MAHSNRRHSRAHIADILGRCVERALALKESLDGERSALERQDASALSAAIDNKTSCVKELHALESERARLCNLAGFAAGEEQMEQMITWCDDDSVLVQAWRELMDISAECNATNLTNGAIICARKQQIETSLAMIRGGVAGMDTYGRGGRGTYGPSQQSLAEA